MIDQKSRGPRPPRLRPVRLASLRPVDDADVRSGDRDLDGVELAGITAEELLWSGRRQLSSSRVSELVATTWRARGAALVECSLEGLDVVSLAAAESHWRNLEVQQSRIGSAELYDSSWDSVHFMRCKIGFINLRGAQLRDVRFTDCVIDELDLGRATVSRVAFPGSRIGRIELSGATLSDVDLREAQLSDISSIEGLRGATITSRQLLDLAPILAGRAGILVE